jgi:DNA invertase Pin-like site-specific DNA recombinase
MIVEANYKITASHLKKKAYLYIRQSSLKQVLCNTESTKRQYALKQKAIALGWPTEQVVTIDSDQGQSGASAICREGFKKLVSEVGMGLAGLVIGLEVSRLARNSSDWHRLLEICALTGTLILDEDGLYDPCLFNDRLLLGLKGAMSEAELHVLKARLQGGIFSKAARGELKGPIPVGFVYNETNQVMLDPDRQIQESIRLFFKTFQRIGSASGTVKYFRANKIKFPRKLRKKPNKGDVIWAELPHSRALQLLHNPRYAGAFFFGRIKTSHLADGTIRYEKQNRDQWHALIPSAHDGYISWKTHEDNLKRLAENSHANGSDRKKSPPREGTALLQGIVVCGVCGSRMTVSYHQHNQQMIPDYKCQSHGIEHSEPICQSINGGPVDQAVGQLLIKSMTPLALEVALTVQKELDRRANQIDHVKKQEVSRTRYEADLARRRYLNVDPEHRLVADSLEAEWNQKLRELEKSQKEYEQSQKEEDHVLNPQEKKQIMSLASDFPKLWHNPDTPLREKKRMIRLLIEDVTLLKSTTITVHVRFLGGATKSLNLSLPKPAWELRKTDPTVISTVDRLLEHHTDGEIALILNQREKVTGTGQAFNLKRVGFIRRTYQLQSRYDRLRAKGFLTLEEVANILQISVSTCKLWASRKILTSYRYNDKGERLFRKPGSEIIERLLQGSKQGRSKKFIKLLTDRLNEV